MYRVQLGVHISIAKADVELLLNVSLVLNGM